MTVDWTDETLRSLDALAQIAFPVEAGITADTLKRRARQGKLAVYRPGKAYVASLAGVWAMVQATRVLKASERPPPRPIPLGLTEMQLSSMALDQALSAITERRAREKAARDGERLLDAPAHRLEMRELRRKRAREKYREKKEAAVKADQL